MAKIILSKDDKVLREMNLRKGSVTIGRSPHNDIVINDLAVSAQHAVIVITENDAYLEDLNSTNGTQVNGQPVKKHFFQDQDVVALAKFRIIYLAESMAITPGLGMDGILNSSFPNSICPPALLRVLDGPNSGRETVLRKALTSIGRSGVQTAVIGKREEAYWLAHLEGDCCPIVNGEIIGTEPRLLTHGDVIEVAGAKMKFLSE